MDVQLDLTNLFPEILRADQAPGPLEPSEAVLRSPGHIVYHQDSQAHAQHLPGAKKRINFDFQRKTEGLIVET